MKKIFSLFVALFTVFSVAFAQNQSNYAGSSKFLDNVAIKVQGGVVTPFNDFFDNGSVTPIAVVGVEKYFTPWLGAEVEGRTSIGLGSNYNTHTRFDMVNVSGYAKFNVVNFFDFDGTRKTFEPVVYTGLGWGHSTCSQVANRNFMTYRAGIEFNFNVDKQKAWGVVVNPSVVWGDIDNGKLIKSHGNFELTAGVVYRFKTSNGTRSMSKARLYNDAEVAALNARIAELENTAGKEVVKEVVREVVTEKVIPVEKTFIVTFAQGSAALTDAAKETLDAICGSVNVEASASPEGTANFNQKLSNERAAAVANYLKNRGVTVVEQKGVGSTGVTSNRIAIVTVQ